ncbi:MAG: hypothetical protein K6L76_00330 [Agarilytica sp.]
MPFDNIALIAAAEIALVLLVVCLFLFIQNRSQKRVIKKLQDRMLELVEDLKSAKSSAPQEPQEEEPESHADVCKTFLDQINDQIEITREHHTSLEPDRDIVLDLAPDTELPRRAAALRYAMLLAEKEAVMAAIEFEDDTAFDWSKIRGKYQQIFDFYEDYMPEPEEVSNHEDLDALNQELLSTKKRINNLEKFKALYFDLEEKWEASKQEAQVHFNDLSEMASQVEDSDRFESSLKNYHEAYTSIDGMIQDGVAAPETIIETVKITDEKTAGELRHLRIMTADQHKIITELEEKLKGATTDEDRNEIVDGLKTELEKQKRFMQESDTCIQLMEDELQNTHKELDQLKGRLKALPSLKTQMSEIRKQKDEFELKVYALTSENRKLNKKLKEESSASPMVVDSGEAKKLKKDLTDLEERYANLEEKYLDLKIGN